MLVARTLIVGLLLSSYGGGALAAKGCDGGGTHPSWASTAKQKWSYVKVRNKIALDYALTNDIFLGELNELAITLAVTSTNPSLKKPNVIFQSLLKQIDAISYANQNGLDSTWVKKEVNSVVRDFIAANGLGTVSSSLNVGGAFVVAYGWGYLFGV